MYYEPKDMLRASVIPVLLGDCSAAHLMAFRIYHRCGIISYICDEKRSLVNYLNPFSRFFHLVSLTEQRTALDTLEYLSSNRDYLPIILPCNEFFQSFVEQNRDFLETRFIISDKASFFTQKPMSVF